MNVLKDYMIPFRGLNTGVHDFGWKIDKTFFEAVDNPEIRDGNLSAHLRLEKKERMMVLHFSISGEAFINCDRCLGDLSLPVRVSEVLYVKFGEENREESFDVIILAETEYQVDVSPYINDYITLALPMKKVHPPDAGGNDTCNPDVIRLIEEHTAKKEPDPRWEQLKNIKLD